MGWLVIESLGVIDLIRFRSVKVPIFYRRLRISGRIARSLAARLCLRMPCLRRLEIGAVLHATGLRQEAYEQAERSVSELGCRAWLDRVGGIFNGLDVVLLVGKLLFEARYDAYLFRQLCVQLAAENPEAHIRGMFDGIDVGMLKKLRQSKAPNMAFHVRSSSSFLLFTSAVLALPLLLLFHLMRHVRRHSLDGTGLTICSVDAPVTLRMMQELFGDLPNVRYVVEPQYRQAFEPQSVVTPINLSFKSFIRYLKALPSYIAAACREWRSLQGLGMLPFEFYHLLLKAEAITPSGRYMCLVTAGHLNLYRAARNALLRTRCSSSINVSKNSYVTYQQFPEEWQMNYNVFAASGKHAVDLYSIKRASSSLLLTGSYDAHCCLDKSNDSVLARQRALLELAGESQLVVFLSPGVCDETISHERRLMALASRLSKRPRTRVVVRRKPGALPPGYESFYEDAFRSPSLVVVTAEEFNLFDFLDSAALFVTSISTSACDVALRGGRVLFVDFMATPDLYLPWREVPGIVSSEADAYGKIEAWLSLADDRPDRSALVQANRAFVNYIGYRLESFPQYKSNLRAQLAPWLEASKFRITETTFH